MPDSSIDWAALYKKHRDAMYRVAYQVLRGTGRTDLAEDATHQAFLSLMKTPPEEPPRSWEALLVQTAKRRALDTVRSAAIVKRVALAEDYDVPAPSPEEDTVVRLDKVALARPVIAKLDAQAHFVLSQYIVLDRPRSEVADELRVTSARVSQLATKILTQIKSAIEGG